MLKLVPALAAATALFAQTPAFEVATIKPAGLTRAVELAQASRASSDSAKAAGQPKSAVPMPPDTGSTKR